MEEYQSSRQEGKIVFVGVDLHRFKWHVTVRTEDQELFSGTLPGHWEALRRLLDRYRGNSVRVVYEAGYFGFWLHDRLMAYGAQCIVTPPSLLPQEYGNRVKTDRRDSRKLAYLLSKGMLRRVWVPTLEERYHRQVVRRRRQLIGDRVRAQNRIKSELQFYGIALVGPRGDSPSPKYHGVHHGRGKLHKKPESPFFRADSIGSALAKFCLHCEGLSPNAFFSTTREKARSAYKEFHAPMRQRSREVYDEDS